MRVLLKRAAEHLATASGAAALLRHRVRDRTAILAYHNVVPAAEAGLGDASLHIPLPRFLEQIDALARTHRFVGLDALHEPADHPRAVVTFDDAYRGAVTLGLPELKRRGIPATVFVAPGLLGARATWWDAAAAVGVLDGPGRDRALRDHAGRGQEITRTLGIPEPALPAVYGIVSEEELREHCGGAVTVGSHTWGHEYLPALDTDSRRETLQRSLEWVKRLGAGLPWIALPYGGGDPAIGREAVEQGYAGVLRIDGGLCPAEPAWEWVPRINVPAGLTARGLSLRGSGLAPR